MSLLADPDRLDRLASQIDGHADELRRQAATLATAIEHVQWHSTAATAFRARAGAVGADLSKAATAVSEAAAALRRHAEAVRRHESLLSRVAEGLCPPLALAAALL
jgi:uncharacterized protein YukE